MANERERLGLSQGTAAVTGAQMSTEDFRALTPLIHAHVNPYGSLELDMDKRLIIDFEAEIAA